MSPFRYVLALGVVALIAALSSWSVSAGAIGARVHRNQTRFRNRTGNHNWTQPASVPGGMEQIFQNPNAPFINSLVNGTAFVFFDGRVKNISEHVAYATAYHNVLATPSGNNPHIHPSGPNYLWAEAGTNFGVFNDNDCFPTLARSHCLATIPARGTFHT